MCPGVVQGVKVVVVQGVEVVMGAAAVLDIKGTVFEELGVDTESMVVQDVVEVAEAIPDLEDDTGFSLPA